MRQIIFFIVCLLPFPVYGVEKRTSAAPEQVFPAGMHQETIGGLEVAMWIPEVKHTPSPWPVMIFSHGFTGCNTQSSYLLSHMAREGGYAIFAPNHKDNNCNGDKYAAPEHPFEEPKLWSEMTYQSRGEDIRKLLDALEGDERFSNAAFDWQHIILCGHSLGGYTVLGVAGAYPTWEDKRVKEGRIKAVLAWSPYAAPFVVHKTLGNLHVPVMYQTGTHDMRIIHTSTLAAHPLTPKPALLVDFQGATHGAWADIGLGGSTLRILDFSLGFLRHRLKGEPYPESSRRNSEGDLPAGVVTLTE